MPEALVLCLPAGCVLLREGVVLLNHIGLFGYISTTGIRTHLACFLYPVFCWIGRTGLNLAACLDSTKSKADGAQLRSQTAGA